MIFLRRLGFFNKSKVWGFFHIELKQPYQIWYLRNILDSFVFCECRFHGIIGPWNDLGGLGPLKVES